MRFTVMNFEMIFNFNFVKEFVTRFETTKENLPSEHVVEWLEN